MRTGPGNGAERQRNLLIAAAAREELLAVAEGRAGLFALLADVCAVEAETEAWAVPAGVNEETLRATAGAAFELLRHAPPDEVLRRPGEPEYLQRWWIRRSRNRGEGEVEPKSSEALYLHRVLRADVPPPHDHPWNSVSLVVDGLIEDEEWPSGGETDAVTRKEERETSSGLRCRKVTRTRTTGTGKGREETVTCLVRKLPAGSVMYRPARHCHLLRPYTAAPMTLFATGPRQREWNFQGGRSRQNGN